MHLTPRPTTLPTQLAVAARRAQVRLPTESSWLRPCAHTQSDTPHCSAGRRMDHPTADCWSSLVIGYGPLWMSAAHRSGRSGFLARSSRMT